MPPRQVLQRDEKPDNHDAFAMLPSWNDEVIALKALTYVPGNSPPYSSLYSQIMIFDRKVGTSLALIHGISITGWRTADVSALASRHLSRANSESMLLIGTGKLAPYLIRAHASVRALKTIRIWGSSLEKAASQFPRGSMKKRSLSSNLWGALWEICVVISPHGAPANKTSLALYAPCPFLLWITSELVRLLHRLAVDSSWAVG
jgi:ornithine cyclodeaminase/alanine dehydrogenase-like protein (mu-crystallin family)